MPILNGLLDDDEADQTLTSLLGDDEDFLPAGKEDSPPKQIFLRTRLYKQIPPEIVVKQESSLPSFQERSIDMFSRLQEAGPLAQSYDEKVRLPKATATPSTSTNENTKSMPRYW